LDSSGPKDTPGPADRGGQPTTPDDSAQWWDASAPSQPRSQRFGRRRALGFVAAGAAALAGVVGVSLPRRGGVGLGETAGTTSGHQPSGSPARVEPGQPVGAPVEASTSAEPVRPLRVFYSPAYVLAAHSFETTRKARWVAESLERDPLAGLEVVTPDPLTEAEVKAVHAARYVDAVRTGQPRDLAQSQGFTWDPGLWTMVLASNGGVVTAAHAARADGVAGSLSSGLHHAHRDHGRGFCTFNGLALAARAAIKAGARNVLILDLDAHCGGGTYELLGEDPSIWIVDVAVNAFDSYRPGARHTLDLVRGAADYLPTIQARLAELPGRAPSFDLCLYNAGMDPHQDCPVGGLRGITTNMLAAREQLAFDWCRQQGVPVAFVLAGGYTGPNLDQDGLVALHRLTVSAAAMAG
jgi:acetoin utilization deacetylase AcuC-like enzyme